jgi:hypothetical protein
MSSAARVRAARISGLLLRLVAGEAQDKDLFPVVRSVLEAFKHMHESAHEEIEMLGALRILSALGLEEEQFKEAPLSEGSVRKVGQAREHYIARINRGITASGL